MSDDVVFPLMKIYTSRVVSQAKQKFSLFNGPVNLTIEMLISWPQDDATAIFCDHNDLIEEVIITLLNSPSAAQYFCSGTALWNGNLSCTYSSVKPGGENWEQLLKFDAIFEVVV